MLKDVNATPLELTEHKVLFPNLALCEIGVERGEAASAKSVLCIICIRCHSIHHMHTRNHTTGTATVGYAEVGGANCALRTVIVSASLASPVL